MNLSLEEVQEIPGNKRMATYTRNLFSSANREIVRLVRRTSDEVCRFTISPDYVRTSLNNFKRGYIYYDESMEVVGFTIWKEKQVQPIHSSVKNPIHIIDLLLICSSNKSKGLGSIMMKDVELYGIRKHFEYIYLYPANEELVHFYNKNGYNIVAKFPDNLKMAKELFVKKSTRTTRRAQTHGAIPQRIRNNYDEYFANATPLGSQNINNL